MIKRRLITILGILFFAALVVLFILHTIHFCQENIRSPQYLCYQDCLRNYGNADILCYEIIELQVDHEESDFRYFCKVIIYTDEYCDTYIGGIDYIGWIFDSDKVDIRHRYLVDMDFIVRTYFE